MMAGKSKMVMISSTLVCLSLSACQREPAVAPHQQSAQQRQAASTPTPAPAPVTAEPTTSSATPAPNASAESAPTASSDTVVTKLQAFGTEPFWSVEIDGDSAVYKTPDNQAGVSFKVTRSAFAKGVDFTGEMDGKPVAITVRGGPCSDGMSDLSHEFTVMARIGEQALNGCARRR